MAQDKIKRLFNFSIDKEQSVEETEISKDEKGEEVKTIKTVKKQVPQKFFLKKPSRSLREQGQLYYWVKHSECVKAGVLPKALLLKRLDNDNGLLSEVEKKAYDNARVDLIKQSGELEQLSLKSEDQRNEEEKKKVTELIDSITQLQRNIQDFEYNKSAIFDGSAEIIARDKTIMWWVLNLSYKELDDNKNECIFGEEDIDSKTQKLDEIEENEDQWLNDVVKKFIFYVTIWFLNPVENEKQFNELMNIVNKEQEKKIA